MSINNALIEATQEVLRTYLAPELAEKLTEEILQRARPEIEAALATLAGFEFAKGATGRAKTARAPVAKVGKSAAGRRGKDKGAAAGKEDFSTPPVVTVENYVAEAEPN